MLSKLTDLLWLNFCFTNLHSIYPLSSYFVKQLFRIQIEKDGKVLVWNQVKSRMEACYSKLILVATLHSGVCGTLGRCDWTICSLKKFKFKKAGEYYFGMGQVKWKLAILNWFYYDMPNPWLAGFSTFNLMTKAQCLVSYFGDPEKFSMFFSLVFQANIGKKLQGKIREKIPELGNLMLIIPLKT